MGNSPDQKREAREISRRVKSKMLLAQLREIDVT
jgi:hypothetical protein